MIGRKNVKNAASRLRQKSSCSVRTSCRNSLIRRSAPGRRPRASGARTSSPSSSSPRASASAVSSCRRRVGSVRALDDLLAVRGGSGSRSRRRRRSARRRALAHDHAVAQHGDPVGELLGLVEVVRRQQDRLAERAQVADRVPRCAARARVEAGRRLVEEDQLGVADRARARGRGAAAGRPRACARARRASPSGRRARSPRPGRAASRSSRRRRAGSRARSASGRATTTGASTPIRSRHAGPPAAGRSPSTSTRAAVALAVALEDLDRRRLAGAVRAEQAEHLAGLDREVDPAQRLEVAVASCAGPGRVTALTARPRARAPGANGSLAAGEREDDLAAVGLVADGDDRLAAAGDGCAQVVGGRRRARGARRSRRRARRRARSARRSRGRAAAGSRRRRRGARPASRSPSARAAARPAVGQRAQLVGLAGRRLGVAHEEDAHGPSVDALRPRPARRPSRRPRARGAASITRSTPACLVGAQLLDDLRRPCRRSAALSLPEIALNAPRRSSSSPRRGRRRSRSSSRSGAARGRPRARRRRGCACARAPRRRSAKTVLYSSAKRTAARTVRGFAVPPTMIGGRGCCTGFGQMSGASVHWRVDLLELPVELVEALPRRSGTGSRTPRARTRTSRRRCPSSTRPSEMWSTVTTIFASTETRPEGDGRDHRPEPDALVRAASPASVAQASSEPAGSPRTIER